MYFLHHSCRSPCDFSNKQKRRPEDVRGDASPPREKTLAGSHEVWSARLKIHWPPQPLPSAMKCCFGVSRSHCDPRCLRTIPAALHLSHPATLGPACGSFSEPHRAFQPFTSHGDPLLLLLLLLCLSPRRLFSASFTPSPPPLLSPL